MMRRSSIFNALALGTAAAVLIAARPRKPVPEPEPPPPAEVKAEEPKLPAPFVGLFASPLPVDPGPVPVGLANASAQGCNACHYDAHDTWSKSAHATGGSPAFLAAARHAGTPWCASCHRPLTPQQPDQVVYDDGDPLRPVSRPNRSYDPGFAAEGVSCAACHVREGKVLSGDVDAVARPAPHPVAFSPELGSSAGCAACHQVSWPGADRPLYDTYGEWERSPQGKAGITCQSCHMGGGAGAAPTDHAMPANPARAVSVLLGVDRVELVRGGAPLTLTITVQNTGAGHHFPTGTPWRGMRLRADLEGPGGKPATGRVGEAFVYDFVRQVEDATPWRTRSDTRLPAGGEASFSWSTALNPTASAGDWHVVVSVQETLDGQPVGAPFFVRRVPVVVR